MASPCQANTAEVAKPKEDRAQAGTVRQRVISQLALTKPPPQPSECVTAPEEGAQSGNEGLSLTSEDQEISDVDPCDVQIPQWGCCRQLSEPVPSRELVFRLWRLLPYV